MTRQHTGAPTAPTAAIAAIVAIAQLPTAALADPSARQHQAHQLRSVALQQAEPREDRFRSYLRNGKYVAQLSDDGFLNLYEIDEQKAAQLRAGQADTREGQINFEAALPQASRRSILKFDLRKAAAAYLGAADASAIPALPPRLRLAIQDHELAAAAVMTADESPGGVIGAPLVLWAVQVGRHPQLQLRLHADGNLRVDAGTAESATWHTGTCGGVLRGCGDLGPVR